MVFTKPHTHTHTHAGMHAHMALTHTHARTHTRSLIHKQTNVTYHILSRSLLKYIHSWQNELRINLPISIEKVIRHKNITKILRKKQIL